MMTCLLSLSACKKNHPDTPKTSDSKYNSAILFIDKYKTVYRRNALPDSVVKDVSIGGDFGDSSVPYYLHEEIGDLFINGLRIYYANTQLNNFSYSLDIHNYGMTLSEQFDTANWQVVSSNGVQDMTENSGSIPFYLDTIPGVIIRNAGLTIKISPGLAPNSDSVYIKLYPIDTAVAIAAGDLVLSPGQLAQVPIVNDWTATLSIGLGKKHVFYTNGRRFQVSHYRETRYHVNIN
jgi:hypothetical protein